MTEREVRLARLSRKEALELVGEPSGGFEPCVPGDSLKVPDRGDNGVIGDAKAASEDAGARFLEAAASGLAA